MPTNRLALERSPYLRQHANNPVDWYAWGEEAFARARTEQKPIFISIGYSTCHWCHVMEHESFESERVAQFLNAHFIAVKVDREERPDVDAIYMSAVQAMSGNGGWPMSVFTTPELTPFFAGTYFPPEPRYGRAGFLQLLHRIHELWTTERAALESSGAELLAVVRSAAEGSGNADEQPSATGPKIQAMITAAYRYFEQAFDPAEGGFGAAPKFPRPSQFELLFHVHHTTSDARTRERSLEMALFTLRKMALGGMHDHLGGGFHRYSVDRFWRISHFEKMLYDQAQLLDSYLDAYQLTGDELFLETARDIIRYVQHDLQHPAGAFYSAEDADSEGVEGKFYAWSMAEVEQLLGADAPAFCEHFGITREGTFEHGTSVLHATKTMPTDPAQRALLQRGMDRLLTERSTRIRPMRDEKILTSWNGLMIGALARAGLVLHDRSLIEDAARAASFVWQELRDPKRGLLRRWCDGEARFDGYLDDHAFLIRGYLDLYEATFEVVWLERARVLQQELDAALLDETDGLYFLSREASDILVRVKSDHDGAEPAGNSVGAKNLFRLAEFTGEESYRTKAERIISRAASRVGDYPYAMPAMMAAAHWMIHPPATLVFAGKGTEPLAEAAAEHYQPVMVRMHSAETPVPFARTLTAVDGHPTAYLCHGLRCERPVTSAEALSALLAGGESSRKV